MCLAGGRGGYLNLVYLFVGSYYEPYHRVYRDPTKS